jgi:hypothetical protein
MSNVSPYSSASFSETSLVHPYNDTGGAVEKVSSIPSTLAPAGSPLLFGRNA